PAQSGEFAVAQPGEGGEQNECPEAGGYASGEVEDLGDGGDGPLGGVCLPGAADAARVPADQLIIERGVQHRVQQPIRLGDHGGRGATRHKLGAPGPDEAGRDVGDHDAGERLFEVALVQPAVKLDGTRAQVGPVVDPGGEVGAEGDAAGVRGRS